MQHELTESQINFYQENGFLVIENFLDAEELAEWRRCTDESVEERLGNSVKFMTNQMDAKQFYARVFTQCLRLSDTHPGMQKLVHDPRLGKMATQLAGVDGVRIWHDQALIKPPHGNPTAWHLDVPYWSFDSPDALSFWVALDDATLANGCMWYLPGTHKAARFDNVGIGINIGELFNVYPEWKQIEPQCAPCPAGSIAWHNGLVAHGAGANMTIRYRRAMTCGFMPDGCTFNGKKNILPEDYFESLEIGDVLNNDKQNTLIWHKDRDA
jgi:ectoine hydroxylase-related dioxygenase (phytanoyl-CoA dioxygenase family)